MLVRFNSSETGEIVMFAETARQLLGVLHKECSARGTFTAEEMQPAAERLRQAAKEQPPVEEEEEGENAEGKEKKELPISLGRRAWPLIDMLERTARQGSKGYITWEAARDFGPETA